MAIVRYAFLMRPPMPGAMPRDGLIECKEICGTAPSGHHAWGWADYSRYLTGDEISHYDLEYVMSFHSDESQHAKLDILT